MLEEIDSDCEGLQLQATSNFKAYHVDAYNSDYDDEAIASVIFMTSLSPSGSINGDIIGLTYDLDILSEVPHYNTYHENNMLNPVVQEMEHSQHLCPNNDSYDELTKQQDFFVDMLEEIDSDCEGLQLQATSNFKAYHVDAYNSDYDDEAIASVIFMTSLSPSGSINGDIIGLTYDLDILSEVPHYNTYHENNMLNPVVQEMEHSQHLCPNNDSYDELTSDNNVISYAD
nr:hypothetical protein [Tanacetum cinerariifolium]